MKKIAIKVGTPTKLIIKKYGVSRVTAWRASKRGWLFLNYHERKIATSFIYDDEILLKGVNYAKNLLWNYKITKEQKEDCISDAILRCLEIYNLIKNIPVFIARTSVWNAKHIQKKEKMSTSWDKWQLENKN